MKQALLSVLLLGTAVAVQANVEQATFKPREAKKHLPANIEAQICRTGLTNRTASRALPEFKKNIVTPPRRHRAAVKANADETNPIAYFESFEEWPADEFDLNWLPEGWSAQRQKEADDMESWMPMFQYSYGYPEPADGQYYFMILGDEGQDEWLITPEIEIPDGMDLSYYLFYQPFFLFSDENIDYDSSDYRYDGEKIIACDFQVYIKAEGDEEWTKIQDIADKYADIDNGYALFLMNPTALERQNVSLADYYGKKVQIGFRYITPIEGDTMWFDAVRIGISPLEDVAYSLPPTTYYWGFESDFGALSNEVAQVPVFSPVTFFNTSGEDATYTWKYNDPVTGEETTDSDQTDLELVYQPDYTNESTITNNLHYPPTLVASAPGKADTEYAAPLLIQAGGKAETNIDGKHYNFGVFPFATVGSDIGCFTVDDDVNHAIDVPIFGHSMHTNPYWYAFTAGNDEDATPETCYNHLVGVANLYMPEEDAQLVVNGVKVFGYGVTQPEAELKFSIYALKAIYDEDGDLEAISSDPADFTVVAQKTIKGSDILYREGETGQKDYICLPFAFEAPVVVTATKEHPAFFFMLEGFNSDAVEYFAPLQTRSQLPGSISLGYMMSFIDFQAASGRPPYYSVKTLRYKEDGEIYGLESSFAFCLDADFPWLTCDTETVTIGAEDSEVKVPLGSYYDASQLSVEAPDGIVASVAGRYNECELTIARATGSTDGVEGTVTVKGPAVEVSVNVKADAKTSISNITVNNAAASQTYDLFGRRADKSARGLYIVKHNDGSVSKQVTVK